MTRRRGFVSCGVLVVIAATLGPVPGSSARPTIDSSALPVIPTIPAPVVELPFPRVTLPETFSPPVELPTTTTTTAAPALEVPTSTVIADPLPEITATTTNAEPPPVAAETPQTTTTTTTTANEEAATGQLTVTTGPMSAGSQLTPGGTMWGSMKVDVVDSREAGDGWTAVVEIGDFVDSTSGRSFTPVQVVYSAPDTACSESAGSDSLAQGSATAMVASAPCTTSWTATVEITIPPDVSSGTYSAVISHSVA